MPSGFVSLNKNSDTPGEALIQKVFDDAKLVTTPSERPGSWHAKTYDNVTNVLQSLDIPAGAISLKVTYLNIAAAVGVAIAIAIDEANATAGEALINAGDTPQIPLGFSSDEWSFTESTEITRIDFKALVAETGTSKFIVEWKIAS